MTRMEFLKKLMEFWLNFRENSKLSQCFCSLTHGNIKNGDASYERDTACLFMVFSLYACCDVAKKA